MTILGLFPEAVNFLIRMPEPCSTCTESPSLQPSASALPSSCHLQPASLSCSLGRLQSFFQGFDHSIRALWQKHFEGQSRLEQPLVPPSCFCGLGMLSPPGPQGRLSSIPCCHFFLLLTTGVLHPSSSTGGEGQ